MNPKELNEITENVRKRVVKHLNKRGNSIKSLSKDSELSPQFLYQLLSGEKHSFTVSSLVKLANGMNTEAYKLLRPMK